MSLTARVREELAHLPVGDPCCRLVETAAALRFGGALQLGAAGAGWVVTTDSGALARRLHAALVEVLGVRPEVQVHQAGGLRAATTYRLALPRPAADALRVMGLLDTDGRPTSAAPPDPDHDVPAIRGAVAAAGSVSDPRRSVHLEVRAPGEAAALDLRAALRRLRVASSAAEHDATWRVVVKSGDGIGRLLAKLGAHGVFLVWDDARLRRELRGEANRVANADRANLARAVDAAARHAAAAAALVGSPAWSDLPATLQEIALVRLATPEASLAELGALLDPPVGKTTVHRRLERLATLQSADILHRPR